MTIIADQTSRIIARRDRIENDLAMLSWKICSTNTLYDDLYTESFLNDLGINSLSNLSYIQGYIVSKGEMTGTATSDFTITSSVGTSSLEGTIIKVGGTSQVIDTIQPNTWNEITNVVITQTTPGSSLIYHFVSFDNGMSWMIFKDSAWRTAVLFSIDAITNAFVLQYNTSSNSTPNYVTLTSSDLGNCLKVASSYATNQMSITEMEAISNSQWMSIISSVPNCTLNFACALVTDVSFNVPSLTSYAFSYTTDFSNLTFYTNSWIASAINPESAYCVLSISYPDTISLENDIKVWLSTDNGINYEQFSTLLALGTHGDLIYVRGFIDQLILRNTQTVTVKIQTLNDKTIKINSLVVGLRYSSSISITASTTTTATTSTITTGTTTTETTSTTSSDTTGTTGSGTTTVTTGSTSTTVTGTTGTTTTGTTTTTATTVSTTTQARTLNPVEWISPPISGSIPTARYSHSAVLSSNRMYIFGGNAGSSVYLNDSNYLDLSTLIWHPLSCSGSVPIVRCAHIAVMDNSNNMFIYSGVSTDGDTALTDVCSLNLSTLVWSTITCTGTPPSGSQGRAWASGVVYNNSMYVFGGYGNGTAHNNLNALNLSTHVWSSITLTGTIPPILNGASAVVDTSGNMYLFGGRWSSYYNAVYKIVLSTGASTLLSCTGTPPTARVFSGAIYSNDNKMYIFGGLDSSYTAYHDINCLNLSTLVWIQPTIAGTPPSERTQLTTLLSDISTMYVYAGQYGDVYGDTILLGA